MFAIKAEPGSDQVQIANYISYDTATIGGVIERLLRKELISRVVNERDRRAKILEVTPEGNELLKTLEPIVKLIQLNILKQLSESEKLTFMYLLEKAIRIKDQN